jgi:hypothetical protein
VIVLGWTSPVTRLMKSAPRICLRVVLEFDLRLCERQFNGSSTTAQKQSEEVISEQRRRVSSASLLRMMQTNLFPRRQARTEKFS